MACGTILWLSESDHPRNEADDVAARVKDGRAVVCQDTASLPGLVGEFLRRTAR